VRETCARDEAPIAFLDAGNDASTRCSLVALTSALEAVSDEARLGRAIAEELLATCDERGLLPQARRDEARMMVTMLEKKLA
jgi:hypothetical protein